MSAMNLADYMTKDANAAFLMRQDSINQMQQHSSFFAQPMLSQAQQGSFSSTQVSAGMGSEQLMQTIKMLEIQRDALVASLKNPGLAAGQFGGSFAPVSSMLDQPKMSTGFPQQSSTPNLLSMLQQQTSQAPFTAGLEQPKSNIDCALMGGHNGPQGYPTGIPDVGGKRKGDFVDQSVTKKASTTPFVDASKVSSLTGKAVLTAESACAIYRLRPKARGISGTVKSHTGEIARTYGVTAKTIRDIWNRTTWAKDTKHLWTEEETQQYISQRARMSAKLDPTQNLPTWFAGNQ